MSDRHSDFAARSLTECRHGWVELTRKQSVLSSRMLQPRCVVLCFLLALGFLVEALAAAAMDGPNPVPTERREAMAMRHLRYSLRIRNFYWPKGSDPCAAWRGVQCQDGHVTEIHLAGLKRTHVGMSEATFALDFLQKLPLLGLLNASGFPLPGQIPQWFGRSLTILQVLDLSSCYLNGSIPLTLGELSSLQILSLARNQLTGSIPTAFGNLRNLSSLNLSGNNLGGGLSSSLPNAGNLAYLDLSNNFFSGPIPSSLGNLSKLEHLLLANNSFGGFLPSALGYISSLRTLDLSRNSFWGPLPLDLEKMANLTVLNFADNNFSGSISQQMSHWPRLQRLILSGNSFSGQPPAALSSMADLRILNLASNKFSGIFPTAFSDLLNAESIIISDNFFYGSVPASLTKLKNLSILDVSGNFLNGSLPAGLLSSSKSDGNCLSGVPNQRPFRQCRDFYAARGVGFRGRGSMAAPIPRKFSRKSKNSHLAAILGGAFGGLGLVLLTAILASVYIKCERRVTSPKQRASTHDPGITPSAPDVVVNTSQLGEAFSLSQLQSVTQGFSTLNFLKAGHSGDLYKGVLDGGVEVVVKRIEVATKSNNLFIQELDLFGKASHTRLVPLLGHCFELEQEKYFVYKFMPNADLALALHKKAVPNSPGDILQSLDWITRLKIAIGVAEGLSYLHHECSPPLVHRDIKASSILLDDKYEVRLGSLSEARVQDGGSQPGLIARLLRISQTLEQSDPDSPVASCPYDVYCFGKVLLELVSGKLGISDSTDPAADSWIDSALTNIDRHNKELMGKLVDPSLIVDEDLLEEVWAMAIIAKLCLNPKPAKRPITRHILKALENPQKIVREENFSAALRSGNSSRGSWNASFFGSWRKSSSDTVVIPGTLKEEYSLEMNNRKQTGTSYSLGSMRLDYSLHRRPGSNEIFPEPLEDNPKKPSTLGSENHEG